MAQRTLGWSIARSTLLAVSLFSAALVMVGFPLPQQPDAAMSCFTIAGEVICFESGITHVQPVAPIMAPVGPIFGGEDEDIVMRDNGGYEVERG